ncbi:hypothetical protein SAMN04489760_106166 [Syntrophus gentianae]|uniref:Uncharacterized protein n=1 Tax=Syntrophus gentianae TaxID=43775 RepID=A0A1H7WIG7_9BACT|nr:hypothetical protein SAMN04489760_106166 [Syntrophus gentianae]
MVETESAGCIYELIILKVLSLMITLQKRVGLTDADICVTRH